MKKLYVQMLVVLCILTTSATAVVPEYPPLPSGSIEIAYDNGVFFDSQGQILFEDQQLRIIFTPPPETVGGLLKEARIAWSGPGFEGDFFVRIKDAVTNSYVDSPALSNAPSGNWQVVDVSALGFMIPNNDFYIELHQVLGSPVKSVYFDASDSGRSEWSPLTGPWNPIGYNLGIRAVIQSPPVPTVVPVYPPLPPGSIEMAYDDGEFLENGGDTLFEDQQLRVNFTPFPETVGGLLTEARIAWSGPGLEGEFFIRIKDAVTNSYVDSPALSNAPSGNWQVVDVSALGFMIPNNNYYIEVQHVPGSPVKAVYIDSPSYSGRSEYSPITDEWYTLGDNLGIRAVIQPTPVPTAGSISGFKINDTNGNGKWDASEKGISNWTIGLIGITGKGKNANVIRKETLTDATGFYKFDNLQAGRYFVIEKLKKGFVPTSSPVKRIKIAQGTNSMNNNFTNKPVNSRDNKNDNGDIDDYEAINRDINKYKEDLNWD